MATSMEQLRQERKANVQKRRTSWSALDGERAGYKDGERDPKPDSPEAVKFTKELTALGVC